MLDLFIWRDNEVDDILSWTGAETTIISSCLPSKSKKELQPYEPSTVTTTTIKTHHQEKAQLQDVCAGRRSQLHDLPAHP